MKKLVVLLFVVIFFLSSCQDTTQNLNLEYSYEDIVEIKVVDFYYGHFDEANNYVENYDVLKEIDIGRAQEVYDDIMHLELKSIFLTSYADPFGIGIMVVWNDGTYLVMAEHTMGSTTVSSDGKIEDMSGYGLTYVNQAQFYALIDKYMED